MAMHGERQTGGPAPQFAPDPRVAALLRGYARAAGLAGVALGLLGLLGWQLGVAHWTSVLTGSMPMRPLTAAALVLCGTSLWLQRSEAVAPSWRLVARTLGVAAAAIGAATLAGTAFGWHRPTAQALRMSPSTALSFLLAGTALFILGGTTAKHALAAQLLAVAAMLPPLLALLGYAYGALPGAASAIHVSLCSALGLAALALGILSARPSRGPMAVVTSATAGGVVARRLLPASVLLPLALGWVRLLGQRAGLYDFATGLSLLTLTNMVILAALVWLSARRLAHTDEARRAAEEDRTRALARVEAARAEAEASGQRFQTLLEQAPDAIAIVDESGRIALANAQAEAVFGYSRDELIGKPVEMLVPERYRAAHAGHRTGYMANPRTRPMGVGLDLRALRKDGTELPVEISLSPLETERGLLVTAIVRDITERRRREEEVRSLNVTLERRAAELEAANRELEAFSYSVSHDLRAPLRSMDGLSQALLEDYGDQLDRAGRDYLERIRASSQRMGQLITDLLKLSRVIRAEMRREPVDLSATARAIAAELSSTAPDRRVDWIIADWVTAEGDPQLLRTVLDNLLGNAWKFTSRCERARIEFGTMEREGKVIYFVRDSGAGFDMAYADKLFRPFQRLHAASEFSGTGVGLATVQRIVHRHGGQVWAEGEVGKGATFYFTLS